ncbi:MAG: radical SAM protein [Pseudomonadota bacterium]
MKDWTKADWVDPEHPWTDPRDVPEQPERLLLDYATRCNLRCPMCIVWGSEEDRLIDDVKGIMDLDGSRRVLDEVMNAQPMIQPNLWGEPLLIPELATVIADLKSRDIPVAMNTNGLTLRDKISLMFIEHKVDSVMFSIDSVTPETLKAVRGVNRLEKIERNVFRLMELRGDNIHPRIGVSFTLQEENRHEYDAFVERWVGIVDVVRMGLVFDDNEGNFPELTTGLTRKPCPALYTTMPVHNDGTVRLCCLDGFRKTDMGNVFEDGVNGVWEGEEFAKARYYHETEQWDKIPFCESCNGWAEYEYEEEIRDGLLIRKSPQYVYYNKIARLTNWQGRILGGHKAPPEELVES